MSKRLEDFIHNNRTQFDDLEPSAALWNNIEQGLSFNAVLKNRQPKTFTLGFVMRVAAIIIMVMGIGFGFYVHNQKPENQGINLAKINPEYARQQVHYASLVKEKRNELKQVAKIDPDLYREFSGELAKMDTTYKKLNNQLKTSPNRERVLRAMIRNLQIQTEVLNQQLQVIEQFNQYKNQNNNETKNI